VFLTEYRAHELVAFHQSQAPASRRILVITIKAVRREPRPPDRHRHRIAPMIARLDRRGMVGQHRDGDVVAAASEDVADQTVVQVLEALDLQVEVADRIF
jgi:hypothetical protein